MLKKSLVSLLVGISIVGLVGCSQEVKNIDELFFELDSKGYSIKTSPNRITLYYHGIEHLSVLLEINFLNINKNDIDKLCSYFECSVGDFIKLEEVK